MFRVVVGVVSCYCPRSDFSCSYQISAQQWTVRGHIYSCGVAWHAMAWHNIAWHGMAIDGNAAGTTLACIQMFRSFYVQTFAHMYVCIYLCIAICQCCCCRCSGWASCACHHRSCLSASLHSQPRAKVLTFSRCCLCQGAATLGSRLQMPICALYMCLCLYVHLFILLTMLYWLCSFMFYIYILITDLWFIYRRSCLLHFDWLCGGIWRNRLYCVCRVAF